MKTTAGPAPGFIDNPGYRLEITASEHHWTVQFGERVLADTRGALVLTEPGFEPVVYFPEDDVLRRELIRVDGRSVCPYKGEARYFVLVGSEQLQPIGWIYPSAYDEVLAIEKHVAFYANRVVLRQQITPILASEVCNRAGLRR